MAQSLKKRYDAKRVKQLREHVQSARKTLLAEHQTAQLIIEALDEDDLQKVSEIIDKLRGMQSPQLPVLSKAIKTAIAELNKYTAGGPLTKAWTKIKKMVGIDNPVVKITTFADALERGLGQFPQIIKNNLGDLKNIDTSKSLSTLLSAPKKASTGTKSDQTMGDQKYSKDAETFSDDPVGSHWPGSQNEADGGDKKGTLKVVADQMLKALAPNGLFGAFKQVPYINTKELVQELVTAPINAIAPVIKRVQTGAKAADVAKDMKTQVSGTGNGELKGGAPGKPGVPTTGGETTAPVEPANVSTGTASGALKNAEPRGGGIGQGAKSKLQAKSEAEKLYGVMKSNFGNMDEKTVKNVIAILSLNGQLKE